MAELPRSRRSSPGSARRASGSTPGPGARRSSRSGRGAPRSGWSSPCRSTRRSPRPSRSGSSSTGWPARSPPRSTPGGWPRPGRTLRLTLDLAFARAGTPGELVVEQRFPEPTADAEAIERLLLARLERTPPPAAVERLELELAGVEPAVGQQLPLFVPQAARTARLGWQLARLALTFGEDRIRRVALADPEAPLAERRWSVARA